MALSIAIVGLPNVGKSTLFNALLQKQQALAANYPFATIEPNVGVMEIPDWRLDKLAEIVAAHEGKGKLPPRVYATVSFVDIAGLVRGASKGEGLGNQFLANIRECDAVCHVLRDFADENVIRAGSEAPIDDLGVIRTELMLADLATLEKQREPKSNAPKDQLARWSGVNKLKQAIGEGKMATEVVLTEDETVATRELMLLSSKTELYVLNVDENALGRASEIRAEFAVTAAVPEHQIIIVSAKVESELSELTGEEKKEYMEMTGINESGLDQLARAGYRTLGLMSFLTAGEIECRAWTIRQGMSAVQASGVIHTDFMNKFIKARVTSFDDFVTYGGWKGVAEGGRMRMEGRDYIMRDGDVVEFMIGN